MISVADLSYAYPGRSPVLRNVSFSIPSGVHIAIMGSNGSGKTTLALLLKGLLQPSSGIIEVDGFTCKDDISHFEVMKRVGLVFQNPDNTIVSTTVERELAFGMENLGISTDEMKSRIDFALVRFDLERYRQTNPANLSGGEKQRCALAAVMVMHPSYLILDEPTSLLDPGGKQNILRSIRESVEQGATAIHITQFVEEARMADRVIILKDSGICLDGVPGEVLVSGNQFRSCDVHANIASCMSENLPDQNVLIHQNSKVFSSKPLVKLTDVGHIYNLNTPFKKQALSGISISFLSGSSTALLGPSGSGKTTLLEIAAGITAFTSGTVDIEGKPLKAMAFQFPEDQIFGETLDDYICFGPRNIGIDEKDLADIVSHALMEVGLDPETYHFRDPFSLSGGEQRRIALAGVLAMQPDMLILDEPIAGLDRFGMEIVIGFLENYIKMGGTLFFSTHDFEVAHRLAHFTAVLCDGRLETYGSTHEVFNKSPWIQSLLENLT
ncbi:MAG: ATP-binding cassette domain-containing protein [Candidatus Latescibacteria bacterium]|nr:ATP-binding cassette domain-containing protein [Candidatus Latescibacterota bacterium]